LYIADDIAHLKSYHFLLNIITFDIDSLSKNYNHKLGEIPMKDFKKYLMSKNIVHPKSFTIIWIGLFSYMFFAKQILGLRLNLRKSLNIWNSYLKTLRIDNPNQAGL